MRTLAVALLALLLVPATAAAAKKRPGLRIHVVSNRADLISAGDALVRIEGRAHIKMARIRVTAGRRDVTRAFRRRANGRIEGLVTGLKVGRTVLKARAPGRRAARAAVINHPNGGPVLSGPQVQPWQCQAGATDTQCNQPPSYAYSYKSSVTGQFAAYDPKSPPPDVATTTTQTGEQVPFIVRTETGYQNRDQYKIAVLYQPGKGWKAWAPQRQFTCRSPTARAAASTTRPATRRRSPTATPAPRWAWASR